jgi:hypothetical protein
VPGLILKNATAVVIFYVVAVEQGGYPNMFLFDEFFFTWMTADASDVY